MNKSIRGNRFIDLAGHVFGRLTVERFHSVKGRFSHWVCRCSCGGSAVASTSNLRSGNTQSCGCFKRQRISETKRTHGKSNSQEYRVWRMMVARCSNPKVDSFPLYGGRGITVCPRWIKSFSDFMLDMGERPVGFSIERRDTNGNYDPSNCLWASLVTQGRNRRTNHVLTVGGVSMCISAWAERLGVKPYVVSLRLRRGWTEEKAVTTPLRVR